MLQQMLVTWTGIRPLIMSNPQTVQISNPYSIEARRLFSAMKKARRKEDESILLSNELLQMRNDWEASAYWDDKEKKFFIPDTLILACIKGGATALKKGKDVDRAILMAETHAFVQTKAVKSLNEAYADPNFACRMSGPCRIPPKTGALIWKCRCMMPTGWKLTFTLEFDSEIFPADALENCQEIAGKMVGLGGWRPKFGRFTVETEKL